MPWSNAIRPPLLSEWECERVARFSDRSRRSRWLAGRALAKALVRERFASTGIVDIREGSAGEPILYQSGLPEPTVWLGIEARQTTVAAVVADRPVSIAVSASMDEVDLAIDPQMVAKGELKTLATLFDGDRNMARGAALAIKEAALRTVRAGMNGPRIREIEIDAEFGVVADDVQLRLLAVLSTDKQIVAVVGRQLLHERRVVRVVRDGLLSIYGPDAPKPPGAIERSKAKARRLADARSRWRGLRPA
jgi:hypothetical protein